jgi:hypothetical protein
MKAAVAGVTVVLFFAAFPLGTQAEMETVPMQRVQVAPPAADLSAILLQVQQAASSANANIGKLRIEKWKTDSDQKKQLQQIADSLQKNIANAMPGLISDVQASKGSALASFKLYHNLNVLYEFLSGLADAAGSLGKREEYEPLAADAASIDTARQNLSSYIEQTVGRLEAANRPPAAAGPAQTHPVAPGKKVVVINEDEAPPPKKKSGAKATKKKASPPSSTPPAQSPASPH